MLNIASIARQVKFNCNVSDARFWGYYSPCGILLRLRDLFRIENSLNVWENVQSRNIATWIGEREALWEELSPCEFRPIEIQGRKFNPFNMREINMVLSKQGFFYGAGYGDFLKPTFLLAEITRHTEIGRHDVFILGTEIARDLASSPAMLRGNTVIARMETLALFLWNKLEEMRARKYDDALSFAFSEHGIKRKEAERDDPETLAVRIRDIARDEIGCFIHHELGESSQRRLLGKWWKKLIIDLPYGRAERFLRDLKDILADTCTGGMLDHIIREKRSGSLGFYCALLAGYRKIIFCDLQPAFDKFLLTRNWSLIEGAKRRGYSRARDYITMLKNCVDQGTAPGETEKILLKEVIPGISVNPPSPLY